MPVRWEHPETWRAGDSFDADTMNDRIRDQNSLLLRKPMLVATQSANQTITPSTTTALSFDTLVQDDDGMCVTGTPATSFTVHREGTYQVWFSGLVRGNGSFVDFDTCIELNGTLTNRRWDSQSRILGDNTVNYAHNLSGVVMLFPGETITVTAWQNGTANTTMFATLGTPRLVIMWLGIT